MNDRNVLRDALDDVTVDALVTNTHADEMANQLADALHKRGYSVVLAPPDESHIIEFADDVWIIQHPMHERLSGHLFECTQRWTGDRPSIGRFFLNDDGTIGDPL